MPSPTTTHHGDTEFNIAGVLAYYRAFTPGCAGGNNATTFLLEDCPQPDVNLRILTEYGGSSWVEKKYLHGSPEMLTEVCNTTGSIDLHQKFDLYEKAGVQEYVVIIVPTEEIRWHRLVKGKYRSIEPDSQGIYRSRVFPGLWLDGKAFFKGEMAAVLATLQKGIDSDEHQRFVAELAKRKR